MSIYRDFSDEKKEELLGYVDENEGWFETSVGDFFGNLFRRKHIKSDMSNVSKYQRKMIDYLDVSKETIETIFNEVHAVDDCYASVFSSHNQTIEAFAEIISSLAGGINTSGGTCFADIPALTKATESTYSTLTYYQWETILQKPADQITSEEYSRIACIIASSEDPNVLEGIINQCYIPDTEYRVQFDVQDGGGAISWVPDEKMKTLQKYLELYASTLFDEKDPACAKAYSNLLQRMELFDLLINNKSQVGTPLTGYTTPNIHVTRSNGDFLLTAQYIATAGGEEVGTWLAGFTNNRSDAEQAVLNEKNPNLGLRMESFDRVHHRCDPTSVTHVITCPCIGFSADESIKKQTAYYYRANFGGTVGEAGFDAIVDGLDDKVRDKIVDAFKNLVPGEELVIDFIDFNIDVVGDMVGCGTDNSTFSQIEDISKVGTVADMFGLTCTSSYKGSDVDDYRFTLYPSPGIDSLGNETLSTTERLANYNSHVSNPESPAYNRECVLTLDDILSYPQNAADKLKVVESSFKSKNISYDISDLCENPFSAQ